MIHDHCHLVFTIYLGVLCTSRKTGRGSTTVRFVRSFFVPFDFFHWGQVLQTNKTMMKQGHLGKGNREPGNVSKEALRYLGVVFVFSFNIPCQGSLLPWFTAVTCIQQWDAYTLRIIPPRKIPYLFSHTYSCTLESIPYV